MGGMELNFSPLSGLNQSVLRTRTSSLFVKGHNFSKLLHRMWLYQPVYCGVFNVSYRACDNVLLLSGYNLSAKRFSRILSSPKFYLQIFRPTVSLMFSTTPCLPFIFSVSTLFYPVTPHLILKHFISI